jgi:hypothetical protein
LLLHGSLLAQVIVTLQKTGYEISDATVMYGIMTTSLPGLLNPLLLALLYGDYRRGYVYVLKRICCCCWRRKDDSRMMKSKSAQRIYEQKLLQ